MVTKDIGIGQLGLGIVGNAVADILLKKADSFTQQIGAPAILKKVLVHDVSKQRIMKFEPNILTDLADEVLDDPELSIIIELIGGEHFNGCQGSFGG